jgi:hypothetical protein
MRTSIFVLTAALATALAGPACARGWSIDPNGRGPLIDPDGADAGSAMDPNGLDSFGTMDPNGASLNSRGTMDPDGRDGPYFNPDPLAALADILAG